MVARASERVDRLGAAARGAGGLDGITAGAVGRDVEELSRGEGPRRQVTGRGDRVESRRRASSRQMAGNRRGGRLCRTNRWARGDRRGERAGSRTRSSPSACSPVGRSPRGWRGKRRGDRRAASRNRTADALVPALGSRSGAARDLAASIAACAIGGGWGAEHAAPWTAHSPRRRRVSRRRRSVHRYSGVASLAAALVAAEPRARGFWRDATRPRARASNVRTRTDRGSAGGCARGDPERSGDGSARRKRRRRVGGGGDNRRVAGGAERPDVGRTRKAAAATFSALPSPGRPPPPPLARYPQRTRGNGPPRGRARRAPCERTRKHAGRARLWTRSSPPCDLDRGRATG